MRRQEAFDESTLQRLSTWLGEATDAPFGRAADVTIATAGRSNVTAILADDDGRRIVLRRPPLGPHLPTAHDVCREARIMSALQGSGVPVPEIIAICDDDSVIGAPFFVMAFVDGQVLDTVDDAETVRIAERASAGVDLSRDLAALHLVDPAAVGLDGLSKPAGFVERQLRRWVGQWMYPDGASETGVFRDIHERLVAQQPPDSVPARIVHGDYRIGNAIVKSGRVLAVLDWELTSLGHPMADLAYMLNNWVDAAEARDGAITSPTAAGGFGDRAGVVAAYEDALGALVDTEVLRFFRAFSYWRLASIRSGVASRLEGSRDELDIAKRQQSLDSIPKLLEAATSLV